MLDDEGTKLAMQEYLSGAGKYANSENLAQAITTYWSEFGDCNLQDQSLASRTAHVWLNKEGYS